VTRADPSGRRWLRRLGPLLVVAVLVGVALQMRPGGSPLRPGTSAPPLAVALSDGVRLDLAQPPGEVLVLNFWASWCAPCRAEAPELTRVHEALVDRGQGRVVGLAVEALSPAKVAEHAQRFGMRFPVAPVASEWADRFNVHVLPTTVVLGPDGSVQHTLVGAVRAEDVLGALP
jgi:cytochrome c biogenesis protein CcmG, thiol:disulfide interchange protein DsbE